MRTMKKFFSAVTIVALLVTGNPGWMKMTCADENGAVAEECGYDDDAIDALFHQREQLMLEMSKAAMEEKGAVAFSENVDYDAEFDRIDDELQALGVRKIDPTNEEDMAYLKELPAVTGQPETVLSGGIYDDAPNLSLLTTAFDLYVSDGSVTPFYDGTEAGKKSYSYRVVSVKDKKEGSTGQLFEYRKVKMLTPNEIEKNQVSAILEYGFGILVDEFTGIFLDNPVLEWTLGAFEAFMNASKLYAPLGDDSGYTSSYASTTTMNYYYLYNPDFGWKLIASCASTAIDRADRFVGEINAKSFNRDIYNERFILQSGSKRSLREYVAAYVSVMDIQPNYFMSAWFGNLKLKAYGGRTAIFQPKYADTPLDLMALAEGSTYH